MMISVWTNSTAIFILIGARTTEQSQVKHELSFCAKVLLGNIRRIFLLKNLGYWNAYQQACKLIVYLFIKIDRVIVTQIGFCGISRWPLTGFLSNHKKALLRQLLHLHSNLQLIPSSGLPCGRDRPSTLFYANNRS